MSKKLIQVYKGKKVLVTGHTGFKGSWLTIWLTKLGAKVAGFSLPELPTTPANFALSKLDKRIKDYRGDIRNYEDVEKVIKEFKPDIVFHLAAQPILLRSYEKPKLTFDSNAGGTVNVLEAIRNTDSVKALVSITTDKVYKNKEWVWGYREHDELGDTDPYAASKAMAEFAIHSYRTSYFDPNGIGDNRVAVASARAGNVVGGGDFADFRIIPDCIRSLINKVPIEVRNPKSTRPWQLVLEPLSGYLWLGANLLTDETGSFCRSWNFGPRLSKNTPVSEIVDLMIKYWESGTWVDVSDPTSKKKESKLLMLDWSSAQSHLGWEPVYDYKETIEEVVSWFKEYVKQKDKDEDTVNMFETCSEHIDRYVARAKERGIEWSI